jgi:hypothetical protein
MNSDPVNDEDFGDYNSIFYGGINELGERFYVYIPDESSQESKESDLKCLKIYYHDNVKTTKSHDVKNFLYVFCLALIFVYFQL